MADESVNKDGDTGNGGGDATAQLTARLEALESEAKQKDAAMTDLKRKLDEQEAELLGDNYLRYLDGEGQEQRTHSTGGSEEKVGDGFDPERATPAQTLAYIEAQIAKGNEEAMKAVAANKAALGNAIGKMIANVDYEMTLDRNQGLRGKLTKGHEDFDADYEERFYQMARNNGGKNAQWVYDHLAMELDSEARKKQAAEDEKAQRELDVSTEKGGLPASVVTHKRLTPEEAVKKAYDATFGKRGIST